MLSTSCRRSTIWFHTPLVLFEQPYSRDVAMPILQLRKVKIREVTCPKTHSWYLNWCLTLKLVSDIKADIVFTYKCGKKILGGVEFSRAKAWIRWG